jgi:ferrous iron transport protein A
MSLADVPSGERVRIEEIRAGRTLRGRLMSMGILPGVEVTVLTAGRGGPVIVAQNDCRIALGMGMSSRIIVSRLGAADRRASSGVREPTEDGHGTRATDSRDPQC